MVEPIELTVDAPATPENDEALRQQTVAVEQQDADATPPLEGARKHVVALIDDPEGSGLYYNDPHTD